MSAIKGSLRLPIPRIPPAPSYPRSISLIHERQLHAGGGKCALAALTGGLPGV